MSIQIPIPCSVSSRSYDEKADLSSKQIYHNHPCLLVFVAVLTIVIVGCLVAIGVLLNTDKTSRGKYVYLCVMIYDCSLVELCTILNTKGPRFESGISSIARFP